MDPSPVAEVTCTAEAVRTTRRTGAEVRTSGSCLASTSTYAREPPVTVRQTGDPLTESIPWCSRNRNRYRAGYSSAVPGAHDQTAETSGIAKCCTKYGENPCRSRNSPSVGPASLPSASSARARRWKAVTAVSIRTNRRSAAFLGCAKSPRGPSAPAYSRPHPSHRTDMLISDSWVSTPSSAKSRSRCG